MRAAFERRRNLVVKMAKEISGFKVNIPDGAFYVFPECDSYFGKKTQDGKTIEKIDGYQYVTNDRAAWVKSEYCNNVIVFDDQWKKNALQIYHK